MEPTDPKKTVYLDMTGSTGRIVHQTDAPVIAVVLDEIGFWPIYTDLKAEELNHRPLTPEQIEGAFTASMFGWHESAITKPILDWLAERKA